MRKATTNQRVIKAISLGLAAFLAISAPMTVCAEPGSASASASDEGGSESGGAGSTGGSENSGTESSSGSSENSGTGSEAGTDSGESDSSGITEQKTTETVDNGDGSQTVTTTTTVTTDLTIEAGSAEEKDDIEEEQKGKQEELKQEIEEKGGSYEYEINVTDESTKENKSEGADTEEAARKLAEDDNGINVSVEETDNTKTITIQKDGFQSKDEAQEYIDQIKETLDETVDQNVTAEITIATEEIPGEVTTELTEENGYHTVFNGIENGVYSFTVVITGGLETIDLSLIDDFCYGMMPGSEIGIKVTVENQSNDDYVVEEYKYTQDGPYKYVLKSKWKDGMGTIVTEFQTNGDYYAYIPADDWTEGQFTGITNCTPSYSIVRWYKKKNGGTDREARAAIRNNPKVYLAYYNDVLGVAGTDREYTDLYTAWAAYFNERCWEVEVGEDRQDPETYFREVNGLDTGASVEIPYTLSLNGYNTDNPYECTYWSFVTGLILKIKPLVPATYQANINYDHTYHYQVNYDVVTESYRIDIDGVGSYQVSDRVITRLPDEDNGGGGSSTTQVVEIGDVTVPLTDSIVLSDEAVPLADSVVIPDEDAPLADSVPQTGDDALSVLPGLAAGLAALVGVFGLRRKERE